MEYKKWNQLPVGTKVLNVDGDEGDNCYAIILDGLMYEIYTPDGKLKDEASPIRDLYAVLEDETLILPFGYQSPLWKVLNGENYE